MPNEGLRTTVNLYKDFENLIAIEKLMNSSEIIPEVIIQPPIALDSLAGIIGKIEGVLNRKKQVILYGPPGTGKTYWAEKACLELASRKAFKKTFEETSDIEKTYLSAKGSSKLNKRIVEHIGRDARNLQIGHSYFMEKGIPIKDFDKLRKIVQEDVIPLIEEYCYSDYITLLRS